MSAQPEEYPRPEIVPATGGPPPADDDRLKRELARELHDQVVQDMTAMLIDLENFKSRPSDWQSTVHQVDSVQGTLRSMLGSLRGLLYGLRGEDGWETDFAETLRVFAVEYTARTGVRVPIRVGRDWPDPIRRPAAQHLYRIVQEAVNNARQHGGATTVRVSLRLTETGQARLRIRDDGRGLPAERDLGPGGMGVLGMRERAMLLGGSLNLISTPGRGLCISVTISRSALS